MFRVWSPRRGIAVSPLADFTPSPNTRFLTGGRCSSFRTFLFRKQLPATASCKSHCCNFRSSAPQPRRSVNGQPCLTHNCYTLSCRSTANLRPVFLRISAKLPAKKAFANDPLKQTSDGHRHSYEGVEESQT